jgi:hypothetical protein
MQPRGVQSRGAPPRGMVTRGIADSGRADSGMPLRGVPARGVPPRACRRGPAASPGLSSRMLRGMTTPRWNAEHCGTFRIGTRHLNYQHEALDQDGYHQEQGKNPRE